MLTTKPLNIAYFPPRLGSIGIVYARWRETQTKHVTIRRILVDDFCVDFRDVLDWPIEVLNGLYELLNAAQEHSESGKP